jgi:SAM-dependent methyltransferase
VPILNRKFWNANTHYHGVVLASLPPDTSHVLDVGCGDGILAAQLAAVGVSSVVALDIDRSVLERACALHGGTRIDWIHGNVLTAPLEPGSFDAVVSVAALHHMDAAKALMRFAQLVRPGGAVIVIGLAASTLWDTPLEYVALGARMALGIVYGRWNHSAPQCWPPPLTYGEIKELSARLLPGVRYRRHFLGRYSLVWCRPQRFAVLTSSPD